MTGLTGEIDVVYTWLAPKKRVTGSAMVDYIRELTTGILHRVLYETRHSFVAVRCGDNKSRIINKVNAVVIEKTSPFPGAPEVLKKNPPRAKDDK